MADSPIVVTFRFYEELNDFLTPEHRKRAFERRCPPRATTKHMIEALGVPHTEVELVFVNGESVGFDRVLADGDRVAVYPMFEAFDVSPLLCLRERPLRATRFIADSHLGGLAHLLRLFGFDTLYDNHYADDEIVRLAVEQGRIVLTRDRGLLKRREVTHGCYVRALHRDQQLHEVFERFDLAGSARPFTRCLRCNAPLRAIDKVDVVDRLPPGIQARHDRYAHCDGCDRIYWEGSHWRRMRMRIDALLPSGA